MESLDLKAFIVTPIGDDNSDTRRAAEGVIDAVIIPKLIKAGFQEENITVAHRLSTSGSINKQIITRIVEDDIVIANLTSLNPNVMYELAIRHAIRKPVIQICEYGTRLPFDIVDERTIFYTNDMQGVLELGKGLEKYINESIKEELPDNPIYRAIEAQTIIKQSTSENIDINKYFIERLDSIENVISNLGNSKNIIKGSIKENEFKFKIVLTVKANEQIEAREVFLDVKSLLRDYGISLVRGSYPSGNLEVGEQKKISIYCENNKLAPIHLNNIDVEMFNISNNYEIVDLSIL